MQQQLQDLQGQLVEHFGEIDDLEKQGVLMDENMVEAGYAKYAW